MIVCRRSNGRIKENYLLGKSNNPCYCSMGNSYRNLHLDTRLVIWISQIIPFLNTYFYQAWRRIEQAADVKVIVIIGEILIVFTTPFCYAKIVSMAWVEKIQRLDAIGGKNMAGIDYVSCGECGKRLFYDGDYRAREYMRDVQSSNTLTCSHCVSNLKKKIEILKKHDRRRH